MDNKKILIEIPTWLGDATMATPAIENIVAKFPKCKLIIFGSKASTTLFLHHPNLEKIIIDDSRDGGNRYLNLRRVAKSIGKVDLAFSFRRNFTTKFFLWFVDTKEKFIYKRYTKYIKHQVVRYNDFVNKSLNLDTTAKKLKIYLEKDTKTKKTTKQQKPILGINPGATYGSAKRWYPKEFAKVAIALSKDYDIVIFGGDGEIDMADDIEKFLKDKNITNYQNIAGKTTLKQLINHITNLNLFITNDSGPMHLASAFSISTVCIFGPTKYKETKQWKNPNEMTIKKDYICMPCMKRVCPLSDKVANHQCMKDITSDDVLKSIFENLTAKNIKKKKLQKLFKKNHNLPQDTKLVLFKANNFKQNGVIAFINIVKRLVYPRYKAIICGDDASINFAKKEASKLEFENQILFVNYIHIKTCDVFVLPTTNKKFSKNVLEAMQNSCVVFTPKINDSSSLLDIFATMQSPNDHNTSHKVDAILFDNDNLNLVGKQNKKKTKSFKLPI
jgi:heptosyltransferase-2